MPPAIKVLAGDKFGRLTIVREGEKKCGNRAFICVCDCGKQRWVQLNALRGGRTRSCGCLNNELAASARRTHGMNGTPEHYTWEAMLQRCHNPANAHYGNYGGRGITVCDRWRHSFENFYADMGPRPVGLSLDRIDNNAGYSPENCRWATRLEQNNNLRTNLLITFSGVTLSLSEWSRRSGVPKSTLRSRIKKGWSMERVFSGPGTIDGHLLKNLLIPNPPEVK